MKLGANKRHPKVSFVDAEQRLLAQLKTYTSLGGEIPSNDAIGARIGVTSSTVSVCMRALQSRGVIEIARGSSYQERRIVKFAEAVS